jgi:hypothetical protein
MKVVESIRDVDDSPITSEETNKNATKRMKRTEFAAKLPTVVYHVLSDDNVDELLRKCGLPTNGTRESKIDLHREYTLAYNAEVDAGVSDMDLMKLRKTVLSTRTSRATASFFGSGTSSMASVNKPPQANGHRERRMAKLARKRERAKWSASRTSSDWRAVFSDLLNRPIYYNSITRECTTERPLELETGTVVKSSDEDDVILVTKKM